MFVKKSPACTIADLAWLKEIFKSNVPINILELCKNCMNLFIKRRDGKTEDNQNYYKVAFDDRDLNYTKYFEKGMNEISLSKDYNSHNTKRLDINEVKNLLINLILLKVF